MKYALLFSLAVAGAAFLPGAQAAEHGRDRGYDHSEHSRDRGDRHGDHDRRGDHDRWGGRGDHDRWDGRGDHDRWYGGRDHDRRDGDRHHGRYRGRHDTWYPGYAWRPHYDRYRVVRYQPPRGYYRHHWRSGEYLPRAYYGSPYVVDYWRYGLPMPPRGYHYVRVDGDVVLAAIATGLIADVVYDLFYH